MNDSQNNNLTIEGDKPKLCISGSNTQCSKCKVYTNVWIRTRDREGQYAFCIDCWEEVKENWY